MKRHFMMKYSKTLLKIITYISLTLAILVIILSNIFYSIFEKRALNQIFLYNKSSLSQLSYNIDYFNEIIKNFCVTQFSNPDNIELMLTNEYNSFNEQKFINRMKNIVASNSMIHSVILYNSALNRLYSTSAQLPGSGDEWIKKVLQSPKSTPSLSPIPRTLPKETYFTPVDVFTYVILDINKQGNLDRAFIVNIKIDWLFENLKKMSNSNLFLIDKSGTIVADGTGTLNLFQTADPSYTQLIKKDNENCNSVQVAIKNSIRIVTYFKIPSIDWVLVNDEPYEKVTEQMNQTKMQMLIVTVIFLIIALCTAIFISRIIYKPFNNLVQQVRQKVKSHFKIQETRDDADYVLKAFDLSVAELQNLEEYKKSTREVLEENLYRAILLEDNLSGKKLPENYVDDIEGMSGSDNRFRIIAFKIDQYSRIVSTNQQNSEIPDNILIHITNGMKSIWPDAKTLYMGNGDLVSILVIYPGSDSQDTVQVKDTIKMVQRSAMIALSISLSAFVSEIVEHTRLIASKYRQVENMFNYRIFHGNNCLLDEKTVDDLMSQGGTVYPEEFEEKLRNSIKLGDLEDTKKEYYKFIEAIPKSNIDHFTTALIQLALSIHKEVNNVNINRIVAIKISINDFLSKLLNRDTLDDINTEFLSFFEQIIQQLKCTVYNKYRVIVDSIKEYISMDFPNKDLSLKGIATEFKLSPVYLGKIFKESTGISVNDYIHELRLEKASKLLNDHNYSVKMIMDSVGYDNEGTFYKLFKKRYGITPKEYRTNMGLNKNLKG